MLYEQVAVALQRWIGAEDLQDLSPLAKILQCAPDHVESILDKLRVRRLEDKRATSDEEKKPEEGRSTLFDESGQEKAAEGSEDSKKQMVAPGNNRAGSRKAVSSGHAAREQLAVSPVPTPAKPEGRTAKTMGGAPVEVPQHPASAEPVADLPPPPAPSRNQKAAS